MNNKPFVRKLIYIICIGILVIPLSLLSRPQTSKSNGGVLAQLRTKHSLAQSKMSDIDPASETMKLASLGLRGVAVNMLWMQAGEHRKNENYDELRSTLKLLTKIQPNFVRVWEYQAHNLAYNISMEFDDYEQRYMWVKRGLSFLKQGIPHNKRDHRMTDNMGFFTGNKFGKSDERTSYRRLFRADNEFHKEMCAYATNRGDGDSVDRFKLSDLEFGEYGPDSWKLAYLWYGESRDLVELESCRTYRSDVMFYMLKPAQLRNGANALQEEFPPSDLTQSIWREADSQWREFGSQQLVNSQGTTIKLEGLEEAKQRLALAREELDKQVAIHLSRQPDDKQKGGREALIIQMSENLGNMPEEDKLLLKADADQLTDEQNARAQLLRDKLQEFDQYIDENLARTISQDQSPVESAAALKALQKIREAKQQITTIGRDAETVNYGYWRVRNEVEWQDRTMNAHQALNDAEQVWRQSAYDDEYEFDYRTKEKKVTRKGAITLYLEAFELWKPILSENPRLGDGQLADRIVQSLQEYQKMLGFANREWPDDFPLQSFIDARYKNGERDGLPTTEYLNQLKGLEDDDADRSKEIGGKPKTSSAAEPKPKPGDEADQPKPVSDQGSDADAPSSKSDGESDAKPGQPVEPDEDKSSENKNPKDKESTDNDSADQNLANDA